MTSEPTISTPGELITILYPLYGSKLDDFVIVTLDNEGECPTKVVVRSEIPGYTDQAVSTVDLDAGETLEVRQNPRHSWGGD